MIKKNLFLIVFLVTGLANGASLISTSAGRVGDDIVTTREVMLNHLIETALYPGEKMAVLQYDNVKSRDFIRATTSVLIESAVAKEADAFTAVPVTSSQLQAGIKKVDLAMKKSSAWGKLAPSATEEKRFVERKMRAKDFIKFKIDSAAIPISDQEAEEYFNTNRLKFENLPFANFKDTIKSYLTKQRVDKRLKDWFELLQSKYRVRNMLAE